MTSLVKHLGNTQIEQVCFSISEFVQLYYQVRRICNKNLLLCLRLNRVWFEIVYIVGFFLEYLNITQHSKLNFIHHHFYHQHKRDDKNPANIILSRTKNNKQTKIQEWDLPFRIFRSKWYRYTIPERHFGKIWFTLRVYLISS